MKKNLILLIITNFIGFYTFSQSSRDDFSKAQKQYENGNYPQAIQNLKALELSLTPNPKVQSLLVYAYVASNDFVRAKIELEKYKRLAAYATSNAHQKLLQQEAVINAAVRRLEEEFRNKEMTPEKKMRAARVAILATYPPKKQNKTKKEIEDIRNYFETSRLLEKKYNEFLQRIANVAATELKKKNNTFSQEQIYFNQVALASITVGSMKWTTENLKMTYFRDGTPIVMAKNEEEWVNYFHAQIPCWRYHQYDPNQDSRLGLEYNMYALMNEKQIAPEGWRVPTINDWKDFSRNVGAWNELYIPSTVFTMATKDGSKKYGSVYWNSKHRKHNSRVIKLKGKNKSGFSAIPNRPRWYSPQAVDRNDNSKAVWWAMTPTSNWLKNQHTISNNLVEVRKNYDTESASFYFTSVYNDRYGLSTKNTIFVYWDFLKEDELAKAQNRKPKYTDNIYTYDITKFNMQAQIQAPLSYEKRFTTHMQGYPIRLID